MFCFSAVFGNFHIVEKVICFNTESVLYSKAFRWRKTC